MRAPGFTLLEALVAAGLASVLAGIGVVQLVALVESARVAGAARTVATVLRLARGIALSADAATEVRFDPARGVCETRNGGGTLIDSRTLPPGLSFASLPARRRIVFGGLGTADNGTIVIGSRARSRRVVVNQRGRVRVQ